MSDHFYERGNRGLKNVTPCVSHPIWLSWSQGKCFIFNTFIIWGPYGFPLKLLFMCFLVFCSLTEWQSKSLWNPSSLGIIILHVLFVTMFLHILRFNICTICLLVLMHAESFPLSNPSFKIIPVILQGTGQYLNVNWYTVNLLNTLY